MNQTPLLDQIRVYSEALVDDLPEVTTQPEPTVVAIAATRRRSRNVWVAVAAAVITLLLVGLIPLLTSDVPPSADTVVTTLAESTPTTVVEGTTPTPTTIPQESPQTVVLPPRLDVEVTWTEVEVTSTGWQWSDGDGPNPCCIQAASNVILGEGDGVLWSSEDGETWERIFSELTEFSIAVDGPVAVVAGTRNDGTHALFISDDGKTWSEVDHSILPETGRLQVVETTRSGLTWFRTGPRAGRIDGVFAVIADDQLIDIHIPPWDMNIDGNFLTDLVETASGISLYQVEFNSPRSSYAWSYLGDGQWSQPVEIPISSDHLRVGDTILMIDQTNATCCGNPIPGESHWPFLASNDGVNWTEISSRAGSSVYPDVTGGDYGVHSLELAAGESFWVYGPQIGGGGGGIEVDESSTLWISTNGTDWQPLDVEFSIPTNAGMGFLEAVGDFIFVDFDNSPDGTPMIRWVGKVKTG